MSTMKSKRPRPDPVSEGPPDEVMDRVAELLPEGVLDAALKGSRSCRAPAACSLS